MLLKDIIKLSEGRRLEFKEILPEITFPLGKTNSLSN